MIFLAPNSEQVHECSKAAREQFAKCPLIEDILFFLRGEMLLDNKRNTSWSIRRACSASPLASMTRYFSLRLVLAIDSTSRCCSIRIKESEFIALSLSALLALITRFAVSQPVSWWPPAPPPVASVSRDRRPYVPCAG